MARESNGHASAGGDHYKIYILSNHFLRKIHQTPEIPVTITSEPPASLEDCSFLIQSQLKLEFKSSVKA